jgi:hypothetical protein
MIKKLATGISISLFSLLATLIILEVVFRLFTFNRVAKWNDRPSYYFADEKAATFQDIYYDEVKAKERYRIAAIGDSFTFAPYMQLDDPFPKRLERWLNLNRNQPRLEVINYGVPAYSTSHEVPVVERAIKNGADLILMQITLNDPEIKSYTPQELYRERNRFGELEIENPIIKRSLFLSFVASRLHNQKTRVNYEKKFFSLFDTPSTWENFKGSWEKIAKIGDQSQTRIVAVVFPLFGLDLDDEYPFWPIHEKVSSLLNNLNITHIDISSKFKDIPLIRMQVIPGQDFHPNEIAHRIAAEAILEWFNEKKLIPEEFIPKLRSQERVGIKKPL